MAGRREFLAAGGLALAGGLSRARAEDDRSGGSCAVATSRAVVAGPDEPGDRLLVEGRLFAPDGDRPAAGAILYAYHTDRGGLYNAKRDAPPRLRGWMKTDADGRFEYDTIRPGPYPRGSVPAHVHHQAWGGGWPGQWLGDLQFDDDPYLSASERERSAAAGRFAWILKPRREPSGPVVELNLRLKPGGADSFETNILHGRSPCGL